MSMYKKQYPGVYTPREQEILDRLNEQLKAQVGKPAMFGAGDADPTLMALYAKNWDPWNPLYNDPEYAKNTKWGGVISIPCWKEPGAMFPTLPMDFGDRMTDRANLGGAFEILKPIYAGDKLEARVGLGRIVDITPEEGGDSHIFYLEGSGELYNQNNELVMRGIGRGRNGFATYADDYTGERIYGLHMGGPGGPGGGPGGPGAPGGKGGPGAPPPPPGMGSTSAEDNMVFTDEIWEQIFEMWKSEKIRGAEKRYWEDVNVGDEPQTLCSGPISEMDMIRFHGMQLMQQGPFRDSLMNPAMRANLENFRNKYGVYYSDMATHYCGQGEGKNPILFNTTNRNLLIRVVTNWMGDDGWLKKIDWHFSGVGADSFLDKIPYMKGKGPTNHGSCGQCMLLHGYVTDKYISEEGEHMVDLTCWAETWDKKLTQIIGVSVVLPTKGE